MPETNIKNKIYTEIRRSIIMGYRKPGERLIVEDLADSYHTSITPIRDTLQMLSQEGLVTVKPRAGYFITQITVKELRDMFEMRNILELAALERTIEHITEEQITELRDIHHGYTGDDDESYDRYTDENRHFHYSLAEASGNQELARNLGRLLDRLARFMVLRHAGKTLVETHERILDGLQKRDLLATQEALLDDIGNTFEISLERIIQTEGSAWHVEI